MDAQYLMSLDVSVLLQTKKRLEIAVDELGYLTRELEEERAELKATQEMMKATINAMQPQSFANKVQEWMDQKYDYLKEILAGKNEPLVQQTTQPPFKEVSYVEQVVSSDKEEWDSIQNELK